MVKKIKKIGNAKGVILDPSLLKHMRLDVGDEVELTMHASGSLTLTPVNQSFISEEEAERVMDDVLETYSETFTNLA